MKQTRVMPAVKSLAEEAAWRYKNRARLDKDLLQAARKGPLKRLDRATRKARLAASKAREAGECGVADGLPLARHAVFLAQLVIPAHQRVFMAHLVLIEPVKKLS